MYAYVQLWNKIKIKRQSTYLRVSLATSSTVLSSEFWSSVTLISLSFKLSCRVWIVFSSFRFALSNASCAWN